MDIEMREWLMDCFPCENDQETIEELTHEELISSINRYYDGGMKAFKENSDWIMAGV